MKFTKLVLLSILIGQFASAESWVIGLDADMSSVAMVGGEAIQHGIELAIDEINASGGVLGEPLSLVIKDHRGNPARGIANIKSFAKDPRLLAIFGGVHTPVAIAELPTIHEFSILYLDPWAAGTPVINNGYEPNYAFRLSVRDEWAGEVILSKAKEQNCPAITLMLEQTGWGRSNEKSMGTVSNNIDLPITGIEWFNWNSKILGKIVKKLSGDGVECIGLVANTPEGVDIVKAISELDADKRPKVFSHWGITGGNFIEQIGLEALAKVDLFYLQTLSYGHPKTKVGQSLKRAYELKYGKPAGHNAFNGVAHAYDLVHLLALAVEKAKSADAPLVQKALEALDRFDGAMKQYNKPFTANNHEALDASDYLMLRFNTLGYGEI